MTSATEPASPRPVTPTSILADRLARLVEQFDTQPGADATLAAELRSLSELAGGLDPYLSRWTTPESPALQALVERTRAEDWASRSGDAPGSLEQEMLSGHVEGQTLKMLVHATGARRVLEIGMFTGYSALAMAEALPPEGTLVACEIDPDVAAFAEDCFRASASGEKIRVEVGPALTTLSQLAEAGATFDIVFIDADKAGYEKYVDTVLQAGLLAADGLICVDNTLMQGQPWCTGPSTANGDAIAAFNSALATDPRVEQVIVPLRDGLTLIRRVDAGGPSPG